MASRAGDRARPPLRARLPHGDTFKQWPQPADRVSPGRSRCPARCAMGRELGPHTMNRRDALKTLASFHGIFTATTTR